MEKDGAKRLVPRKHLREGGTLVVASCLLYTDQTRLRNFLNIGGNAALMEGPIVKIDGILATDGSKSSLYALLIGVARLVTDYRGVRQQANCELRACPHKRANRRGCCSWWWPPPTAAASRRAAP